MIEDKQDKLGLSIYVTHSGNVTLKIASNIFAKCQPEFPVLASFNNEKYTVLNQDFLTSKGLDLPKVELDFNEFIALIEQIKGLEAVNTNLIMVCCDANLGVSAGHDVTQYVNDLLAKIKPQAVAFFTSTSECNPNAQAYLNGVSFGDNIQIPVEVTSGFVTLRSKLTEMILNNQPLPKLIRAVQNTEEKKETSDTNMENLSTKSGDVLDSPVAEVVSIKEKNITFVNLYKSLRRLVTFSNDAKIIPLNEQKNKSSLELEDQRPSEKNRPKPGR